MWFNLRLCLIDPLTAGECWDIPKLRSGGVAGGHGVGGPFNSKCKQGKNESEGTVTVSGVCYDDGAVNYWLAGVILQTIIKRHPHIASTFRKAMKAHTWGTKGGPEKRAFLSDGEASTLGAAAAKAKNAYIDCSACTPPPDRGLDWQWGVPPYRTGGNIT